MQNGGEGVPFLHLSLGAIVYCSRASPVGENQITLVSAPFSVSSAFSSARQPGHIRPFLIPPAASRPDRFVLRGSPPAARPAARPPQSSTTEEQAWPGRQASPGTAV